MFSALSRSDPRWQSHYAAIWFAVLSYGLVAFAMINGPLEVWFEAFFFVVLFPLIVWSLRLRS